MKIPKFLRVKPSKKGRATTGGKPLRIAASARGEEMAEPNMKLSRALLIVLVLHVVAVSGIIAFNAIKTRQSSSLPAAVGTLHANTAAGSISKLEGPTASVTPAQKDMGSRDQSKTAGSTGKQSGKRDKKAERAKSSAGATGDPAKVYVVAKGDNPVSIAKKLKVSYDELLALNHIEDPHKLQIGQKLLVPPKSVKAKKTDE
jgi:LysM repeat protein